MPIFSIDLCPLGDKVATASHGKIRYSFFYIFISRVSTLSGFDLFGLRLFVLVVVLDIVQYFSSSIPRHNKARTQLYPFSLQSHFK